MMQKITVIGHRGASALYPENTMPSFEAALRKYGASMVEFDVQMSRDGIPVVIHDDTLERTTSGRGRVRDFSFRELRSLDAGYRFDPQRDGSFPFRGRGLVIPSLEEVISSFPDKTLAIEIKDTGRDTTEAVLGLIERHNAWKRVIAGSLEDVVYHRLFRCRAQVKIFSSRAKVFRMLCEYRLGIIRKEPWLVASLPVKHRFFDLKSARWIQWLKKKQVTVYYWTVNSPGLMQELMARQADGLMCDDPGLLTNLLAGGGTARAGA